MLNLYREQVFVYAGFVMQCLENTITRAFVAKPQN
tara:strand:+ start:71 stop:175 length:105 start_codon:yes stop_codon:yes gene_type:complete